MTAVRFEIRDRRGRVKVPNGMLSVHENADPQRVAEAIFTGADPGWSMRLWFDVDLVGSLDKLGDPTVTLPAPQPERTGKRR